MPVCRKCSSSFPNRLKIDGKTRVLSSRKFCLQCSPYNQHNTMVLDKPEPNKKTCSRCKHLLPLSEFRYYSKEGKKRPFCYCNACDSLRVSESCRERKIQAVDYRGGKCESCGYCRCLSALEFHHVDPRKKDIGIAQFRNKNFHLLKIELDKCQLLCSNCHREKHEEIRLAARQENTCLKSSD